MKTIRKRSMCGISSTLDIIGDKWSLLIIRDMIFFGKKSYGDFLNSNEKIATNILADRLTLLENEGILTRHVHPDNKSKFIFKLTEKGRDILPILLEMLVWGNKYLDVSERGKAISQRFLKNREEFLNKMLTDLQE